eukprot:3819838-Amphidinium_carterae.1
MRDLASPACSSANRPSDVSSCQLEAVELSSWHLHIEAYTFEYQGNASKLVHTPLTDKCYLTLMHGMHLGYGGNPYGPAGTGQQEPSIVNTGM